MWMSRIILNLGYWLQIHTHMCYSNFSDIIHSIIDMDAVVITIENSRSDEKLLSVFREGVAFGAAIGPGVYDIHSPRIPSTEEMAERARKVNMSVNQYCWATCCYMREFLKWSFERDGCPAFSCMVKFKSPVGFQFSCPSAVCNESFG